MRYTTGEMAAIFGMTKEGIRFLERKGMITSRRDEKNGYRYFGRPEISLLKHLRSYCAMGFSLEEAHRMICNTPQDEVLARLDEKLRELSEKEEQLRRMKAMLTDQRHAAQWALTADENFEICMSPDLLIFPRRNAQANAQEREAEKAWIAAMPPVTMVAECDETGMGLKGSAVLWQEAQRLSLPVTACMYRREPVRCVHGVLQAPLSVMPDITPMKTWAGENGLACCGSAICLVQLTFLHEDGNRWTVHEVYLPVCEKNTERA